MINTKIIWNLQHLLLDPSKSDGSNQTGLMKSSVRAPIFWCLFLQDLTKINSSSSEAMWLYDNSMLDATE